MKHERLWRVRGLLVGLLIGMSASLYYSWVLDPPAMGRTTAASLNPHDQEVYRVLVAAAYASDGNLDRARRRLAGLEDADGAATIVALAERYIAEGSDTRDVRVLARLADALGRTSSSVRPFIATLTPTETPTATHTPTATLIPTPTATSMRTRTMKPPPARTVAPTLTRTPALTMEPQRFQMSQSTAVCDAGASGLLRVYVRDEKGKGMPGMQILVSWPGGEDRFYTGFKPDFDPGYADFEMQPGEVYEVALVDVKGDTARDVGINRDSACSELPPNTQPSWQIVFQLP